MDYPFGSVNGINKKCAAVLEGIQVLEMKVIFIPIRDFTVKKNTHRAITHFFKLKQLYNA